GHHGGSWKVAYADFVTAMMAFFLVMWLLAISSEQGKAALADYFKELTLTDAVFNGGMPSAFDPSAAAPGILQGGCFDMIKRGKELEEREQALAQREAAVVAAGDDRPEAGATNPTDRPQDPELTDLPEGVQGGEGSDQTGVAPGQGLYADGTGVPGGALTDEEKAAREAQAARDAANQALGDQLRGAVAGALGGNLDGQLSVEVVPGGLRVELMDKEKRPLFVSGQPRLTQAAQQILAVIAERLRTIPNKISIEGHTDAVVTVSQELTNWEISTARASAARRLLARQGIDDARLTMVAGFSSTRPLPQTSPLDPVNRRISVMIWDEGTDIAQARPGAPQPAPGTSPPSAGDAPRPRPPAPPAPPPQATRPMPVAQRPNPEDLEHQLLEDTLSRAAAPEGTTAGPPVPAPAPGE
ncbi:MAG: OmpA family protein, partial [Deltaproteobacteria bacterium]|nr:OmpA family protein [Deltaproteobacteria bacterium]